jgi:hypothetical protein
MSNNTDVISNHNKLTEEVERLQYQLRTEREAHGRVRQEVRDLREESLFLRNEVVESAEKNAADLRRITVRHNDAVLALDNAADCAAKAVSLMTSLGVTSALMAVLDSAHLLGVVGAIACLMTGILTGIVVHALVLRSFWEGVE